MAANDVSPVRLIVSDLDGSLLVPGGKVPPENARALRRACVRGIAVAIASGRLASVCSRIALDAGLPECRIIGMNGAQVRDRPFGEMIREIAYPPALAEKVAGILEEEGCVYSVYTHDGVFTNRPLDAEAARRYRANFIRAGARVEISPDACTRALREPVVKFLVKDTAGAAGYERARARICALPGIYATASARDNFEVMQSGVGKAQAVRALAERLRIPMSAVMAFGDYDNDIEMLAACGWAVAMGNGTPAVKAAARYVTLENTAGGVGAVVDALLDGRIEEWRNIKKETPERCAMSPCRGHGGPGAISADDSLIGD